MAAQDSHTNAEDQIGRAPQAPIQPHWPPRYPPEAHYRSPRLNNSTGSFYDLESQTVAPPPYQYGAYHPQAPPEYRSGGGSNLGTRLLHNGTASWPFFNPFSIPQILPDTPDGGSATSPAKSSTKIIWGAVCALGVAACVAFAFCLAKKK